MGKGTFPPRGLWEHQDSKAALDQEYSMVILQLRHLWDTVPQTWMLGSGGFLGEHSCFGALRWDLQMRQEALFSGNDLMKLQSPFGASCVIATGQR